MRNTEECSYPRTLCEYFEPRPALGMLHSSCQPFFRHFSSPFLSPGGPSPPVHSSTMMRGKSIIVQQTKISVGEHAVDASEASSAAHPGRSAVGVGVTAGLNISPRARRGWVMCGEIFKLSLSVGPSLTALAAAAGSAHSSFFWLE